MKARELQRLMPWAAAAGLTAGIGGAVYYAVRLVRRRRARAVPGVLDRLEESAVEALRRDRVTGGCAIEVGAVGPGIIELTGTVPTQEAGDRAARLLHAVAGVRTVVNRLETGTLEEHLAENRWRRAQGEPSLRERTWYGVRVGTGRRRQSVETDPSRPDDTVERKTRELEVSEREVAEAESALREGGEAESR